MFCSPFQRLLLLQSVFLLLVHFDHDLVFLLQDLQLVFNVASLPFESGQCMLQLLVLFCGEMTLTLFVEDEQLGRSRFRDGRGAI